MTGVWLVTWREVLTRARRRSYVIGLAISVVLVAAVAALPAFFSDPSYRLGLIGSAELEPAILAQAEAEELDLTVVTLDDAAAARAQVADGDLDAAMIDGQQVLADGPVPGRLAQLLDAAHRVVTVERQLRAAGIDPATVTEALAVPPLQHVSVNDQAEDSAVRTAFAVVLVLVLVMLIYQPSIYVAMGVVEEKSSRVVELLLATVRPWQVLAGKIIGIGVLGFAQLAAIAAAGLASAALSGVVAELPPGVGGVIASVFVWFILGYAFFGSLSAALGSLVSRQEDINGVLAPVMVLMLATYLVAFLAIFNPGMGLARALSLVPPFSVVVMPVRAAAGSVPGWEYGLAVALMVLAAAAVLAFGARIYRRAVVRMGARVRLADLRNGG